LGVGTASASFPLEWIRSAHFAPELEQLVDRALKLAESLAEEAEEELISLPPEEEEEY